MNELPEGMFTGVQLVYAVDELPNTEDIPNVIVEAKECVEGKKPLVVVISLERKREYKLSHYLIRLSRKYNFQCGKRCNNNDRLHTILFMLLVLFDLAN